MSVLYHIVHVFSFSRSHQNHTLRPRSNQERSVLGFFLSSGCGFAGFVLFLAPWRALGGGGGPLYSHILGTGGGEGGGVY